MKIEKNLVYFEDTDTPENIKDYLKNIEDKEKEIDINYYGKTDNYSKQVSIDELIEQFNKFNFKEINKSEKNTIIEILNKEKNSLNNSMEDIFENKISAFLSLMDYIIRNKEQYPHTFNYQEERNNNIGYFKGLFSQELSDIQIILGMNPFSFYVTKVNDEKIKLPKIDFNASLNKNFSIIKDNFISDYEPINFEIIYKNYLKFKKNNDNDNKSKMKI